MVVGSILGRSRVLNVALVTVSLCGLASCSQSAQTPQNESHVSAISNRPVFDRFIAVVKLSEPALLNSTTRNGTRAVVDARAKARLLKEQELFLKKLYELAGDPDNSKQTINVLYRYRFVLNGFAFVAPSSLRDKIGALTGVSYIEGENVFARPEAKVETGTAPLAFERNSAHWIGADDVHQLKKDGKAIRGQGVRVGVIDTGIDYTHKMLGGPGTIDAYKNIDHNNAVPGLFPSAKVAGGIDLVGTQYDGAAMDFDKHISRIDPNPIDEGGHGTHVAGTIAGRGDGKNSYDGVAPDAQLYAIKVFGEKGSTSDHVVIAGLEYAADPNQDLDPSDMLDVVNLSLGSGYGTTHTLYAEAFKNLVDAGVVAVCSAGNSSHIPFIVGAPSTVNETISVAASTDNMDHNWRFQTTSFSSIEGNPVTEAVDSAFGKPLALLSEDEGTAPGVYVGTAATDFTEEQKAQLRGNVALVDRGVVAFEEKAARVFAAGAIGLVVINNRPGEPFVMGGDKKFPYPAIMIGNEIGNRIKQALQAGKQVVVDFTRPEKVDKPWLIDSLTDFSSQGPRSLDAHIKPEISAPGEAIVSAAMGEGEATVKMSGTSMAAPHVAGVAALLKQLYPRATSREIKSLIVNSGKEIGYRNNPEFKETCAVLDGVNCTSYPVSLQGAGRVQAFGAATSEIVFNKPTLSLGIVASNSPKVMRDSLEIKNLSQTTRSFTLTSRVSAGISVKVPGSVTVPPGGIAQVKVEFTVQPSEGVAEREGLLKFVEKGSVVAEIPFLAMSRNVANIKSSRQEGSLAVTNRGGASGAALAFQYLGTDSRNVQAARNPLRAGPCDLESAGFRVITKDTDGDTATPPVPVLQIGYKLARPVTTWDICELTALIDADGDGSPDQELFGTQVELSPGKSVPVSTLVDFRKMQAQQPDAVIDTQAFSTWNFSTVGMLEADLSKVAKTAKGALRIKVGALAKDSYFVDGDDFLGAGKGKWLDVNPALSVFQELPEQLSLNAGVSGEIKLVPGARGTVVIYYPQNGVSELNFESQSQLLQVRN